ncbi:hypothetical protein DMA15_12625 [Streptomyces sp. WAC 01529]|uniref:hypothetical protein n=1 Tax=Streptomyces sp. WAC 01529 TaxID=2203205 RepID=UPI000F6CFE5C|nr:hypothetical protein [Streptomyces sp. WAC 01529]AZM53327.1 hypothetical protein DMA15_12625 [Streptomyces sp. WAC 01529]
MTQTIVTMPVRIRVGNGPELEIGEVDLDGPDVRPALARFLRAAADYLDPEARERAEHER